MSLAGTARVFTDPLASPTGFPFKVVQMEGTLSESASYADRERICDLGYLRQAYRKPDGTLGYRCASEPVADFVRKGGAAAATEGRKCLCNGLMSNIGHGQIRADGLADGTLLTAGNDVANVARYLPPGQESYTAADVMRHLLGTDPAEPAGSSVIFQYAAPSKLSDLATGVPS
jgi:nitronate monooxygenase